MASNDSAVLGANGFAATAGRLGAATVKDVPVLKNSVTARTVVRPYAAGVDVALESLVAGPDLTYSTEDKS
jgi:hypothetical protein